MLTQNLPEYWENLYQDKKAYWNLGKPSPFLDEVLAHRLFPQSGRVLVPGAGLGWDANALAQKGYETIAVDFSQTAYESLSEFADKNIKLSALKLDLFDLSPKSTELFDVVYEYTCFSAIHPGRRDEYFEVWHKMLKPDGVIAAVFFPIINETKLEGPPHPTSEGELMARLDGVFEVVDTFIPKSSTTDRAGKERVWFLKKGKPTT